MRRMIRWISAISFLEGLLAFIWLASLPSSGESFSPIRVTSLLGIAAVSAGWLILFLKNGLAIEAVQRLLNWKGRYIFACSCICVPLSLLSLAAQQTIWAQYMNDAQYARIIPVLIWGSFLFIQVGLFLVFVDVSCDESRPSFSVLWKPASLLLGGFVLIWSFISVTKIGVTPDVVGLSWGPPGTPLTLGQMLLVLTSGVWLVTLYSLVFAKSMYPKWLPDAVIFLGLWALAVFLWWREPMFPTHFAPQPVPPNYEYYPHSDAAIFDQASFQLLYGAGFESQLVRRPIYVGLLALMHKLAGPAYDETIFLQILVLAFIPALAYLFVTQLSNRLAGLLAGGAIMLREMNAIRLSGEIVTSHAKLMMSDMLTMLGIVAVLYMAVILFKRKERNPWALASLGACLGLTILVRAQAAILLIPISLFLNLGQKLFKSGLREAILVLLGCALILFPWVYRNWALTGTFVLDDRGEEKLLARNYSTDPLTFPQPLNDETEQEFSARLHRDIISYVTTYPREVLFFVSNHFFHNLVNSALYIAPYYSSASSDGLINQVPFWGTWDGRLNRAEALALVVNLSMIAWGIAIAQQENKSVGWFPFIVFIFYIGGNALVRSSGWRFALPADWIILAYYCIALAYIPSKIGTLIRQSRPAIPRQMDVSHPRPAFLMPAIFVLLFLAGASVPMAEGLIPASDFENLDVRARDALDRAQILSPAEFNTFIQQKGAIFVSGIALYPRYYRPNSRIALSDVPTDHTFLHFWLMRENMNQIALPLRNVPDGIPHTAAVSVLGCRAEGYVSAWAVVIHSNPEQILIRDPQAPLACPLAEPN